MSIFLAFIFGLLSCVFASYEYPVLIGELGDVLVTAPIISTPPEDLVIIDNETKFFRFEGRDPATRPELAFASLEAVALYFKHREIFSDILQAKVIALNRTDRALIQVLKFHADCFNPCIFESIHDPERIIIFGAVFLRTFKAAYPGLKNVKMTKSDIFELAVLSTSWFMDINEANLNLDTFVFECARFYHPEHQSNEFRWSTSLAELYLNKRQHLVFQAAMNLNVFGIRNRSAVLFTELLAENGDICFILHDDKVFPKLINSLQHINHLASPDSPHILITMIREGLFYEELCIKYSSDLANARFNHDLFEWSADFYNEALYVALRYKNHKALRFLVNLDHSCFVIPDYDDDNSIDSVFDFLTYEHRPISLEDFNCLKTILLSDCSHEIILGVPNVLEFVVFNIPLSHFIENLAPHFIGLQKIISHFEEKQARSLKRKASEI